MLSQQLIKSALALTWKTMDDMEIIELEWQYVEYQVEDWYDERYIQTTSSIFSIEKFCYYLLDKKFIIKYYQNKKPWYTPSIETTDLMAGEFWYAIMEYQSWNEKPLIELLTKIKW